MVADAAAEDVEMMNNVKHFQILQNNHQYYMQHVYNIQSQIIAFVIIHTSTSFNDNQYNMHQLMCRKSVMPTCAS